MSDLPLRRILVALDLSPDGRAALELAAALAERARGELLGLFVEDADRLRAAELPCTFEVCAVSAARRPFEADAVERALQAEGRRVQAEFEARAAAARLAANFEVRRGSFVAAALAAALDVDILILGRQSLAPRGATAKRSSRGVAPPARAILVVDDGATSALRPILAGVQLAHERGGRLEVAVVADSPHELVRREQTVRDLLARLPTTVPITVARWLAPLDADRLIELTRPRNAELLLIGRDSPLLAPAALGELLAHLDCPVGIVR